MSEDRAAAASGGEPDAAQASQSLACSGHDIAGAAFTTGSDRQPAPASPAGSPTQTSPARPSPGTPGAAAAAAAARDTTGPLSASLVMAASPAFHTPLDVGLDDAAGHSSASPRSAAMDLSDESALAAELAGPDAMFSEEALDLEG